MLEIQATWRIYIFLEMLFLSSIEERNQADLLVVGPDPDVVDDEVGRPAGDEGQDDGEGHLDGFYLGPGE